MRSESVALAVVPGEKNSVWEHRIAKWKRSGRTQREFCREQRIALSTFQWWRARLKRAVPLAPASFLPLALDSADAGVVEVTLRSSTRVRVQGPPATRLVDALIARLRCSARQRSRRTFARSPWTCESRSTAWRGSWGRCSARRSALRAVVRVRLQASRPGEDPVLGPARLYALVQAPTARSFCAPRGNWRTRRAGLGAFALAGGRGSRAHAAIRSRYRFSRVLRRVEVARVSH